MRDSFELSGSFPHLFVVYGPPGSGKSALVRVLLREMYESAGIEEEKVGKWIWIVSICTWSTMYLLFKCVYIIRGILYMNIGFAMPVM